MNLVVVTASTNLQRARTCLQSWGEVPLIVVCNGQEEAARAGIDATFLVSGSYLGVVPAFKAGVDFALDHTDADVVACLHDDVQIADPQWGEKVVRHFERHAACGLAGFGGAIGLGADDLYQVPYRPMQLARIGFRSNLIDAEVHGIRSLLAEKVACLDGFSQIGHRHFWEGRYTDGVNSGERPMTYLANHGMVHHFYDGALGALAARAGWETWYLPIRCQHFGGQTAVGDAGYQTWAHQQIPGGDQGFWELSHLRGYELFRDVLPLRV